MKDESFKMTKIGKRWRKRHKEGLTKDKRDDLHIILVPASDATEWYDVTGPQARAECLSKDLHGYELQRLASTESPSVKHMMSSQPKDLELYSSHYPYQHCLHRNSHFSFPSAFVRTISHLLFPAATTVFKLEQFIRILKSILRTTSVFSPVTPTADKLSTFFVVWVVLTTEEIWYDRFGLHVHAHIEKCFHT